MLAVYIMGDIPLTVAVRVQLYSIASSPNTLPGFIVHSL